MVVFRLTLLVWLLGRTVRTTDGPPCVVGALQPIVASPGEDVVLPCHLEPSLSLEEAVVEWSRQDHTHVQYVHVYRDHGEVTDMKTESYIRRTALFPEELKHGNISLKIRDVSPADEGSYRCFVPTLRSPLRDSTVQLIIKPNLSSVTERTPTGDGGTERGHVHLAGAVPLLLLLVVAAAAACCWKLWKKQRLPTSDLLVTSLGLKKTSVALQPSPSPTQDSCFC